jgi:hypothetical protein
VQAANSNDTEMKLAQTSVVEIALLALSSYHLAQEDAIHVVRMLRSLVHGFATLEGNGGFGLPLDCNETFQRLLTIFLHGLSSSNR